MQLPPPICKILNKLNASELFSALILVGISILLCYSVKIITPEYFKQMSIGLTPLPMFYVGFFFGHLSLREIGNKTSVMALIMLITICLFFLDFSVYGISYINNRLLYISCVCLAFGLLMHYKISFVLSLFDWLGKYTFELYILHLYYWFIIKGICHYGAVFNIVVAVLLSLLTCVPVHKLIKRLESLLSNWITRKNY